MRSPDMLAVNTVVGLSEHVSTTYYVLPIYKTMLVSNKAPCLPNSPEISLQEYRICIRRSIRSIAYFDLVSDDHMQGLRLVQCLPRTKHLSDDKQLVSLLSDNHDQVILSRRLQPYIENEFCIPAWSSTPYDWSDTSVLTSHPTHYDSQYTQYWRTQNRLKSWTTATKGYWLSQVLAVQVSG